MLLHELAHVDAGSGGSSVSNRKHGERLARARSCRRRWGRGTGRSQSGRFGSDRPERERRIALADRADRLVLADHALVQLVFHHAAASRARPASAWTPGCRWRAPRPRRSPRRRPGCAAAAACRWLALVGLGGLRFLQAASRASGSLPYCSSATLLKSPLRGEFLDLELDLVDLLAASGALPWAWAFSACQISS